MNKGEWLVFFSLVAIAGALVMFEMAHGKAAFVAPRRPMALHEDILELHFHPDKFTFSDDPQARPGVRQTGPFNVSEPIVCKRTPAGSFACSSASKSTVCDEHKCETTEVVVSYFPVIECDTSVHNGRSYIILDSCFLSERRWTPTSILDKLFSYIYKG